MKAIQVSTLLVAVVLNIVAAPAHAGTAADGLAEGKLKADLGDYAAAERAFATLASDATATDRERAEAQVRLGVVERTLGKTRASTEAFQKAMANPGRDADVTRLVA